MNNTSSGNPIKSLLGSLNNIWGYVTAILTLLLAVLGLTREYPITTAILTALVLSVFFCSWRWTQITKVLQPEENVEILVVGERPKPSKVSLWDKFLDINRVLSRQPYLMPVNRRRIEAGTLLCVALFAVGAAMVQSRGAYVELGGIDCFRIKPDSVRVVIANFDNPDSQNNFLETQLGKTLYEQMPGNTVCRYRHIIESASEFKLRDYHPSIVIWGGTSNKVLHVYMAVTQWPDLGEELSVLPENLCDFEVEGIKQIPFLSKYIVSEILFLNGQTEKARQELQAALATVKEQKWAKENQELLANGYSLLGDISTFIGVAADFNQYDFQLAINAYTEAVKQNPNLDRAILNRGFVYRELGDYENAIKDFKLLLEKESLYVGDLATIHTNLGWTKLEQEDYSEAIVNFRIAKDLTIPEEEPEVYYDLGLAYLLAGEFASAQETFKESLPYLDSDLRDDFILGLKEVYETDDPILKNEVNVIVQILQDADI